MPPVIISDASPLIGLAKIGRLNLLQQLYQHIVIPPAVHTELQTASQCAGSVELQQALADGWLSVAHQADVPIDCIIELRQTLDMGEAEAIALALHLAADLLLVDEQRGRAVAQQKGLRIIGTGVVLITAKRFGYITSVKAELEALFRSGYRLSARLREQLVAMAGE